jgi:hypothetical protein
MVLEWRKDMPGGYKMPYLNVTEAKNKLTIIRREALTGREYILADAKRKNAPLVSLISTELLDELCEKSATFTFKWVDEPTDSNETYSLWNNETGIYGIGVTKQEAQNDFLHNIQEYVSVYFENLPYYLSSQNPNREHYWYLRRVLRCEGDTEKLNKLFGFSES